MNVSKYHILLDTIGTCRNHKFLYTFWRLCKPNILVNLTDKRIQQATIFIPKVSIRCRLLEAGERGARGAS